MKHMLLYPDQYSNVYEYVYCSASYNALFLAVREDSRADSEEAPGMQFKHR